MIPHSDTPVQTFVDGGYFAWIYGTAGRKSWPLIRNQYSLRNGILFLMDSPESNRKEYYPLYKSHRSEKRDETKFDQVNQFKDILNQDPSFRKLEITGWEADDLLAILLAEGYNYPAIGRDKDLLQIRGLSLSTTAGQLVTFFDYAKKLPKGISPLIRKPQDILFSLVLMGDKSDDIPRLLPPRKIELGAQLIALPNPWLAARKLFRDRLLRNLYLAVLPGPFCYQEAPTEEEVFELVSTHQWPPRNRVLRYELSTKIKELNNVLHRTDPGSQEQ